MQEPHPLAQALDRLTVQLLILDDVTVRLVREHRLLERLAECMKAKLLDGGLTAGMAGGSHGMTMHRNDDAHFDMLSWYFYTCTCQPAGKNPGRGHSHGSCSFNA